MGVTLASAAGRRKVGSGTYHYRMIRKNVRLAYRRPRGGGAGAWFLRVHTSQGYRQVRLGIADDDHPANDKNILSFDQATRRASDLAIAGYEVIEKKPTRFTVADACTAYLKHLESEGRSQRAIQDARYKIEADVLPHLGDRECGELTTKELKAWRNALVKENTRSCRATANRTLTTLKAALNYCFEGEWIETDTAWRRVKPFKGVTAPREHWLDEDEARMLLAACDGDFKKLVRAALVTGARYGELCALRVKDFDAAAHTLHVKPGKTGRARDVILTEPAVRFFAELSRGRAPNEHILVNGARAWQRSEQTRPMARACAAAGLEAVNFHALRHSYASNALRRGVEPMILARQLGHAGTRMIEQHYGHIQQTVITNTLRERSPTFE